MLSITDISIRIAGRLLIDDSTVQIVPGARVGFVGRNGVGKSTLFHAIRGDLPVESGSITLPPRWRIGSLAQEAPDGPERLINVVLKADLERDALLREAETAADPVFARFVRYLWAEEIIPGLTPPPGTELAAYAEALLARYRNPAIRHRTWQIAMDGSQKLPQRILGTLAENLRLGRDGLGAAELRRALAAVGLLEDVLALPDGLNTPLGTGGAPLSLGQGLRLMLARALVSDPDVLLLVEPTSAVDAHTEARIGARLAAHRSGRTTGVVTASPLLLERVDRVVFVRHGRVAAEGTHAELLHTDPRYRRVVTRGEEL